VEPLALLGQRNAHCIQALGCRHGWLNNSHLLRWLGPCATKTIAWDVSMVILLIQLIYNMTIFYYATLSQVQAKRIKGIYMCQRIPMTIHAHSQAGVMVGAGQG